MTVAELERHRERFMAKVMVSDSGCWYWTAYRVAHGYGQFGIGRRLHLAHRIAYEMFVEPIPEGLQIDHLCRVRHCVNPDHLEPVTQRVNILRGSGIAARCAVKTHCLRGHQFTAANTYRRPDGSRECKTCRTLRKLESATA